MCEVATTTTTTFVTNSFRYIYIYTHTYTYLETNISLSSYTDNVTGEFWIYKNCNHYFVTNSYTTYILYIQKTYINSCIVYTYTYTYTYIHTNLHKHIHNYNYTIYLWPAKFLRNVSCVGMLHFPYRYKHHPKITYYPVTVHHQFN